MPLASPHVSMLMPEVLDKANQAFIGIVYYVANLYVADYALTPFYTT